ncbi:MAG: tetratricopeptide repeat protein [Deltaproteobacteria bacterium]|nr:tetratricopeptide repeat protein [Deltaproteobacteria bacterium]
MIVPIIVLGFPEEGLEILKQGRQLSEDLDDQKSLTRFLSNMGFFYTTRGKHEQGVAYSGRAFEEAEKTRDVRLMAQTSPDLCFSLMTAGRFARVIDIAGRIVKRIEDTGTQSEKFGGPANIYNSLSCLSGYCKAVMGQWREGLTLCKESLERSSEMGDLTTAGLCGFYCGIILLMKGDAKSAIGYLEESVEHLEKAQFIQPLAHSWSWLGFAHTLLGDPSKGLECSQRGLTLHRETGVTWNLASHLFILAWCRAASGDAEGARTTMEEALAASRKNHEKYTEGKILLWMGSILGAPPFQNHQRAEDAIRDGIKILEAMMAAPDVSTGRLFLGELYADMGRVDKAREYMKTAAAMFRDMEMNYWLDRAEKKLQDLGANG